MALSVWGFVIPLQLLHSQSSREVTIHPRDDLAVDVTLLWIGEDGLLVDTGAEEWNGVAPPAQDGVRYYRWYRLDSIVVSGPVPSRNGTPSAVVVLGFFAGMFVGGAVGLSINIEESTTFVLGAVIGAVVGGIFAADLGSPTQYEGTYDPSQKSAREKLRRLCVYPDELPESLHEKVVRDVE